MLYVSRYIARGPTVEYGLVDTDTGIERCVNSGKLFDIAKQFTINGVCFQDWSIEIYQPATTVNRLQAKTLVMKHISVKLYKDMITSIKWDEDAITKPVTIKLADFALKCADYCLRENHFGDCGIKCILEFSDEVAFNETLFGVNLIVFSAVAFDFRKLSDERAAFAYKRMFDSLYQSSVFLISKRKPQVLDIDGRVFRIGLSQTHTDFIHKCFDIVGDLNGEH